MLKYRLWVRSELAKLGAVLEKKRKEGMSEMEKQRLAIQPRRRENVRKVNESGGRW